MVQISIRSLSVLGLCTPVLLAAPPTQASVSQLVPHRAVYAVELEEASDRSGITGMRGRIVYEFRGSACEGFTTNFRFVTQIVAQSGVRVNDQQTSTFESADGETFRFITRTFVDQNEDRRVEGAARRSQGATTVTRTAPDDEIELVLPPASFPTSHLGDLLDRAANGERFYEKNMFDGSNDADQVMITSVVIGPQKTSLEDDSDAIGAVSDAPFRNISIAYFEQEVSGEGLPDYRISFKLHDNGVTRSLDMDYGDFRLGATMEELELLPVEDCS